VASAGPDDNKSWGRCRRPSRSSNRTGPVVHGASPTRVADVGRQRPRAGGRCCVASSSPPRSVSDQCGVAIAHRHPFPVCSMPGSVRRSSRVQPLVHHEHASFPEPQKDMLFMLKKKAGCLSILLCSFPCFISAPKPV